MIGPTTTLFGLVMSDPGADAHVARLYNYLLGFNGLDGAYLSYLVKPEHLHLTLTGFQKTARTTQVHLVPTHQHAAGHWAQHAGPVDTVRFLPVAAVQLRDPDFPSWLEPERVCLRAREDVATWFGRQPRLPDDWLAVVHETTLRPCKITHDDFEASHA
jgi:hypothetical protein